MPTKDLRKLLNQNLSWSYLSLPLDQCQPFMWIFGLLHWMSKCQTVTAGSSAEAEKYATNECVKFLLELVQTFEFLEVKDIFMTGANNIFNDNQACVNWSKKFVVILMSCFKGNINFLHHNTWKSLRY
jgi:hypothetical protein